MLGLQTRVSKRTFTLDVPTESAWAALFAPQAMMWMNDRSLFAAAMPGEAEDIGALRFG